MWGLGLSGLELGALRGLEWVVVVPASFHGPIREKGRPASKSRLLGTDIGAWRKSILRRTRGVQRD